MKIDRYTKMLLSIIAIALTVIAFRSALGPGPSYAARSIEYKVIGPVNPFSGNTGERPLNDAGKAGFEVVGVMPGNSGVDNWLILKR